ncbi:hypothetical protein EXIGLDRAFT_845933 [Exidia glandulosa HHB12029]|uniref:Uncharacterized protein n=1 Tax=Exidia glandulosa HHB12029 TaxID=1314781 RepID=A0A165B7U3_EXIGL|nr:hypothetical protein EXIGLDRAFT_845933 [Exidia glandulosa HHB12029]
MRAANAGSSPGSTPATSLSNDWDDFHDTSSMPNETPPMTVTLDAGNRTCSSCKSSYYEIPPSDSVTSTITPLHYVITSTGNWSRDEFARRILLCLSTSGEDTALAHLMDTFPRLTFGNAKLWLSYMNDVSSRGLPFDRYIMDTFRQTDWERLLREGAVQDVAPELLRLFSTAPKGVSIDREPVYTRHHASHILSPVTTERESAPRSQDDISRRVPSTVTTVSEIDSAWRQRGKRNTDTDNIASGSSVHREISDEEHAPNNQEPRRNLPGGGQKDRNQRPALDGILSRRDHFRHLSVKIIIGDIEAGAVTFS